MRQKKRRRHKNLGRICAMSVEVEPALIRQVEILSKTVQAQVDRVDQLAGLLGETQEKLAETQLRLEVTIEALKTALNEADRTTDDLSTMVVAVQTEVIKLQGIAGSNA